MMNQHEIFRSNPVHANGQPDLRRHAQGFTLIELMIAVVIVGIIAAIAYPSYQQHVYKARRAEAKAAITDVAQRLERWYSNQLTYVGGPTVPTQALQYYTVAVNIASATQYTITATPIAGKAQAGDTQCASLSMNQSMIKSAVDNKNPATDTTSTCW